MQNPVKVNWPIPESSRNLSLLESYFIDELSRLNFRILDKNDSEITMFLALEF
jgi:hypothetical protein